MTNRASEIHKENMRIRMINALAKKIIADFPEVKKDPVNIVQDYLLGYNKDKSKPVKDEEVLNAVNDVLAGKEMNLRTIAPTVLYKVGNTNRDLKLFIESCQVDIVMSQEDYYSFKFNDKYYDINISIFPKNTKYTGYIMQGDTCVFEINESSQNMCRAAIIEWAKSNIFKK